jgi:hypothetical protein
MHFEIATIDVLPRDFLNTNFVSCYTPGDVHFREEMLISRLERT